MKPNYSSAKRLKWLKDRNACGAAEGEVTRLPGSHLPKYRVLFLATRSWGTELSPGLSLVLLVPCRSGKVYQIVAYSHMPRRREIPSHGQKLKNVHISQLTQEIGQGNHGTRESMGPNACVSPMSTSGS